MTRLVERTLSKEGFIMRKKTIIGAALLIMVGVIFGAMLTMSFNDVGKVSDSREKK